MISWDIKVHVGQLQGMEVDELQETVLPVRVDEEPRGREGALTWSAPSSDVNLLDLISSPV